MRHACVDMLLKVLAYTRKCVNWLNPVAAQIGGIAYAREHE